MLVRNDKTKFYHFYPNNVCVVVSSFGGKINAMPVVWSVGISFNPRYFAVLVSKKRYTYEIVSKSKKFTANFLDWRYVDLVNKLGSCSGREVDKIKEFQIKLIDGSSEGFYVMLDAYVSYECNVIKDEEVGDHNLIVGEVINVWYNPELFDSEEKPNLEKVSPIFYLGGGEFVKLGLIERFKEED
ncbi:MAG: flavin reductase family protein [Brevinematia bacterium]